MKYDFTTIVDRAGKDALAVDGLGAPGGFCPPKPLEGFDAIPMWVADMNFPAVPAIPEAIIARTNETTYGYFLPRDEYYDSIIKWHETRNNVTGLEAKHIGYENGVLGGVISALNVLCSKGDNVLIHTPTYIGFKGSLTNNGYHMVYSPLKKDDKGVWRMDFKDMEDKIKANKIHAAIFCSPHNPCGRVWERWELVTMMELFRRYDVYVICDEIWSDLILKPYKHIPLQSVSADARMRTAAFYAPSKTFNLAGLVGSYHIIYNSWLRDRIEKESSLCHYNEMNVLSMHALIGAYSEAGYEWVDELREVLGKNIDYAVDFIEKYFPECKVSKPQGTYMLFVDCSEYCKARGISNDELLKRFWDHGVVIQDGRQFNGDYFVRMNLALPTSRVKEAFKRMKKYVFTKK